LKVEGSTFKVQASKIQGLEVPWLSLRDPIETNYASIGQEAQQRDPETTAGAGRQVIQRSLLDHRNKRGRQDDALSSVVAGSGKFQRNPLDRVTKLIIKVKLRFGCW